MHRLFLVTVVATGLFALGGSATALADDPVGTPTGGEQATASGHDADRRAAHRIRKCERAGHAIAKLERAQARIEQKIARIKEKVASGDLTREQLARARAKIDQLEQWLAKIEARLERLKAAVAEHCRGDDTESSAEASSSG